MSDPLRRPDGREAPEENSGHEDAFVSLWRKAVRGGALATLGLLVSQVISLAGFLVLARLATPATFGAYAAGAVLLGASSLVTEAGMQAAVIQRNDRLPEAAATAWAGNAIGGLCLAALAASCAPVIGLFFHSDVVARAAAVLAGTIPINAVAIVPGALLQRRISFRLTFVQPLVSLSYVLAGIGGLAAGFGVWGLVLATYAAACTQTAAVFLLSRWWPRPGLISWDMWRALSRYGRPVLFGSALREIGLAGSTAIVGRALGTSDLGRFRSAQRLVMQSNLALVFGFGYGLLPAFARIWKDEARFQASILRAVRTLSLIVVPLSLILIPLGRPIAVVLLGKQWRGTGSVMMAMAGVGIALALDSVSSEAFKAVGRTDILPRMHGLTAAALLAFMLALLPLGAPGMGLAMSLGMSAVAVYALRALGQVARIPVSTIVAQITPALGSGLVMTGGIYVLDRLALHASQRNGVTGLGVIVLEIAAAAMLYIAALLAFWRHSLFELWGLARLVVGQVGSARSAAS